MPVYNDEAGLAGWLEAGRDQRLQTEGKQRQALEGLMHKNRMEEGMTEVPSESVHPSLRPGMTPGAAPNTLRVRVTALPSIEKASESLYGRQNRVSQAKALSKQMMENAPPMGDPDRAAHITHAGNLAALSEAGDVPQAALDAVTKFLDPEGVAVPAGAGFRSKRSGKPMGAQPDANAGNQPPAGVPLPFGQKWEPTWDSQSGKFTWKMSPMQGTEHLNKIREAVALGDMITAQRHLEAANYARQNPWTEGGGTLGGGTGALGLPPGQGFARPLTLQDFGVPASPTGGTPAPTPAPMPNNPNTPTTAPGVIVAPLKSAGPGQEAAIEAANTAHMQMGDVMKLLQDPDVQSRMGGLVQNPTGALDRFLGSGALKVPFTDVSIAKKEMPASWVDFQQKVAVHRQLAQKVLEGLRPNQSQIAALAPAMITDNDAPANAMQKAQAWQQYYKDHAAVINNVLGQQRRQQMQMIEKTAPPTSPAQVGGTSASVGVSNTNFDDAVRKWKAGQGAPPNPR